MKDASSGELWKRECATVEAAYKAHPELFFRPVQIDSDLLLNSVGIEGVFPDRPMGYIKLWPQDFIVEEIREDGSLSTVDLEMDQTIRSEKGGTIWADLVKIGLSTIEAVDEISTTLGLDKKLIGSSGIKDRDAITAQRVSFRAGNETVVASLQAKNSLRFEEQFAKLKEQGFWNFFALQRFGRLRLVSHRLGQLLFQGKFGQVIKKYATYQAPREVPYFKNARRKIEEAYGDWDAVLRITDPFPSHFRNERTLAAYLKRHPGDFKGALLTIPEQVRLWVYAYGSFLFNRKLASYIRAEENVPLALPLVLSPDPHDWELYKEYLKADGVGMPSRALRAFPFIQVRHREVPCVQSFDLHGYNLENQIAVLDFSLPKGSYATMALTHFFTLAQGLPLPTGIPLEPRDTKKLIGRGDNCAAH